MKKVVSAFLAGLIFIFCCGFTFTEDDSTDYMALMLECAILGDETSLREGAVYEYLRNRKIDAKGYDIAPTDFFRTMEEASDILAALDYYRSTYGAGYSSSDLQMLAKIIEVEAGSYWLPDYWKLSVGEVVLNRVASSEFPNTIWDVVSQPNQYPYVGSALYERVAPSDKSFEIAKRLLEGERFLRNPAVVFQSNNSNLGSGVAVKYTDSILGDTYFCYSYYPELYEVTKD